MNALSGDPYLRDGFSLDHVRQEDSCVAQWQHLRVLEVSPVHRSFVGDPHEVKFHWLQNAWFVQFGFQSFVLFAPLNKFRQLFVSRDDAFGWLSRQSLSMAGDAVVTVQHIHHQLWLFVVPKLVQLYFELNSIFRRIENGILRQGSDIL